jgi:MFS family permease
MRVELPPALLLRDFRLFWSGAVLSAIGTQFATVAMAWQIYELTNSPLSIGLLGLGRAIPQISLALVGGVLADAIDRRRLMMTLQVLQLVISAGLAALTLAGAITATLLVVAAVLLAFGTAVETPPRQAIVPNLVPRSQLGSAIALNTMQRSIAMIAGPSLAGITLAASGPAMCYVLDAVSWVAMLVALALIRPSQSLERVSSFSAEALLAGVRFVLGQPVIFSFMILDFGATLFGSPVALFRSSRATSWRSVLSASG